MLWERGLWADIELWRLMVRGEVDVRGFCCVLNLVLPGVDARCWSPMWPSEAMVVIDKPVLVCSVLGNGDSGISGQSPKPLSDLSIFSPT